MTSSRLWTVNHVKYGAWYEHIKHIWFCLLTSLFAAAAFFCCCSRGHRVIATLIKNVLLHKASIMFFLSHCTDCPPVLFKVSCAENSVQIGGNPWHYIYTPPRKKDEGTYHICSLKDGTMVYLKFLNYKFTSLLPFSYGCTLSKTWQ